MKELMLKRCLNCGAVVRVINDGHLKCCDRDMIDVKSNSVDASFEKHVPTYEIIADKLVVSVNHVMDDDHYIEWICLMTNTREEYVYLKPGQEAKVIFSDVGEGTLYAYCNKHGLWKNVIEK